MRTMLHPIGVTRPQPWVFPVPNEMVTLFFLFALLSFFPGPSATAEDQLARKDFSDLYTEDIQRSVNRGLQWLAENQTSGGAWKSIVGYKLNDEVKGKGPYRNVGVTSIAGLAFLSAGHSPGRGKYGNVVEKAIQFIVSRADPDTGYISYRGTRMYEHAFATLFLAEVYGMTGRPKVRRTLREAVRTIRYAQNENGGWRYQPRPDEADVSVTVTVLQSLRAVNNAGITVEKSIINQAMEYIRKCYRKDGAFMYRASKMSRTSWALTAAGIVSLQSAGRYDSPMVQNASQWLINRMRHDRRTRWGKYHYFYGHYYASQALYQYEWDEFRSYYNNLTPEIRSHQKTDGRWTDDVSPTYATSMACLILQLPIRYLPIFQK